MRPLTILALIIMGIGFAMVFLSKIIVNKFGLAKNQKCEYAEEMSEEEIEEYKINKAIFNIKIIGLVISIPGIVLLTIFSK